MRTRQSHHPDIVSRAILPLLVCGLAFAAPGRADSLIPGQFVTVNNQHLSYNGQRIRLWGTNFVCNVKQELPYLELTFDRIEDAGFNAIRINLFDGTFLENQTHDTWHVRTTAAGDNGLLGRLDYCIYLAHQRGMFFWLSLDRGACPLVAGDYDILPDDGHRAEWVAMISGQPIGSLAYVDERCQAVHTAYCKAVLNHVNPYTGKTYADEEAIGLYEIFNENSFLTTFTPQYTDQGAFWTGLPAYVRENVRVKWNTWLAGKYASQTALNNAWKISYFTGNLYSGETLASRNIRLDNGPQHTGQRPKDIMMFNAWLYNDYNQRLITALRAENTAGRGINVVPITPTGQFAHSLLRYYGAQMSGDFVSEGSYGFACRMDLVSQGTPGYPFVSWLTRHPFFENPIDLLRVKGKPFLLYETNDYRPNPYGVEYPIRVAAQMAWEDADGVFWFYWDDSGYLPNLHTDADYTNQQLPVPDTNYPNAGLILANDEVQLAALKSAGTIFLKANLPPAPAPFEWTCGKNHLFDPTYPTPSWDELAWWLRYYAWRSGVRVTYNPAVNSSSVLGNSLGTYAQEGDYVRYDWGDTDPDTLKINAPAVRAAVGFTGPSETLGDTTISNINAAFSSIVITSRDGQPLTASADILITLGADSTNTGYSFNSANLTGTLDPWDLALALSAPGGYRGNAPVIVQRVSATITAPWLAGKMYRKIGFDRRCYDQGLLNPADPPLTVTTNDPVFYILITPPDGDNASVSGTLNLQGHVGDKTLVPVRFEFRTLGSDGDNTTRQVLLNADGTFSLDNITTGLYDITVRANLFLAKKIPSKRIDAGFANLGIITLTGGDFNADNIVSFEDFSILQNAYGQRGASAPAGLAAAPLPCSPTGIAVLIILALTAGLAFSPCNDSE